MSKQQDQLNVKVQKKLKSASMNILMLSLDKAKKEGKKHAVGWIEKEIADRASKLTQVEKLTNDDVVAAKARRGAVTTIDYVLSQVDGKTKTLEAAKAYLRKVYGGV